MLRGYRGQSVETKELANINGNRAANSNKHPGLPFESHTLMNERTETHPLENPINAGRDGAQHGQQLALMGALCLQPSNQHVARIRSKYRCAGIAPDNLGKHVSNVMSKRPPRQDRGPQTEPNEPRETPQEQNPGDPRSPGTPRTGRRAQTQHANMGPRRCIN